MFRFKQFNVEHDRSSMKVGTDAVLLASWCNISHAQTALDVGTGCGVIALMLAQRNPAVAVDAVDIDPDSIEEAAGNFSSSPWHNRLTAQLCDFNTAQFTKKYDAIVSNPPFFSNGIMSPVEARRNARHTSTLSYARLLSRARGLLTDNGRISIISPVENIKEIIEACTFASLHISRIISVIPVRGGRTRRVLWEFAPTPCETERGVVVIEDCKGVYSQQYRDLCHDFYLKF